MYKTRLVSDEIFSPSNKIYREVDRAKDLSAPRYVRGDGEMNVQGTREGKERDISLMIFQSRNELLR